ncbi:hypothetical protein AVEN_79275-1 [Araneus ventricosus]|uniref:Uncharacterized protein n=1 Tax=Araneus ventricosus TaxID=182803 RepID=A0A4Y2JQS0_ARAVE|nr:hypothetical protein AVEN_79275-1 [Araneus ventricosus]
MTIGNGFVFYRRNDVVRLVLFADNRWRTVYVKRNVKKLPLRAMGVRPLILLPCGYIEPSSLSEGEVVIVKERGIKTLIKSSDNRKLQANERLLKTLTVVSVHNACQKKYDNPKLIAAALRRGDTGLQKQTVQFRSTSEKFDFKIHCVLCAEEITDSYLEAQTKKEVRQRNIVYKVDLDSVRDSFLKAAETRGDDWGEKIIIRIKGQDLTAKDARYHLFCQRKLYRLPSEIGVKRGYRPLRNVDEAMEYIYSYLEEKSEECQFSMEELLNQIQGEFYPEFELSRLYISKNTVKIL